MPVVLECQQCPHAGGIQTFECQWYPNSRMQQYSPIRMPVVSECQWYPNVGGIQIRMPEVLECRDIRMPPPPTAPTAPPPPLPHPLTPLRLVNDDPPPTTLSPPTSRRRVSGWVSG